MADRHRAGWRQGRRIGNCIAVWWLTLLATWFWWTLGFDTYWLGQSLARRVVGYELLPAIGGILASYGLLTRMDWAETSSPRPLWRWYATAGLTLTVAYALIPPIVGGLLFVVPPPWIPGAESLGLLEDVPISVLFSWTWFAATSMNILVLLGVALITTAGFGRLLGPALGIAGYVVLIYLQSAGWLRGLPGGRYHREPQFTVGSVVLGLSCLALGVWCFAASKGGIHPAYDRTRQSVRRRFG